MRPCEDVIVISDHEEGELSPTDSEPEPEPAPAPGPEPRPDAVAPGTPLRRRYVPPRKFALRASSIFRYNEPLFRQSIPRKFSSFALHRRRKMQPPTKRNILKSDSDSDTENIPRKKKILKYFSEKKISNSSLQSRVTNMIKFNNTKLIKNSLDKVLIRAESVDLEPVDSADNLSDVEKNIQPAPVVDCEKVADAKDSSDAKDLSDEDPDVLRELALKSKTRRVLQNKIEENGESVEKKVDDDAVKSAEGDREIQELRLAALKSAMLKRASKRKRLRKDSKKIKRRSLSVAVPDPLEELAIERDSEESFLLHLNTAKTDYNKFMYNIPDPLYNADEEMSRPHPSDAEAANREAIDVEDKSDDESEEILRFNLLAAMKSDAKTPQSVPKPKLNPSDRDSDSNLIIRLGGSDSESDCEATKNLAIMHKRLEEQTDFQRNLDFFLKGAREATEKSDGPPSIKISDLQTAKNNRVGQTSIDNMSVADRQEYAKLMERMHEINQLKIPTQATFQNSTAMSKRNVYSLNQNRNNYLQPKLITIRKDVRIVTKSSLNTNRKVYVNKSDVRTQGIGETTKVFDQQLILIRKKISSQMEIIENQKVAMKSHQMKKDLLERQIKNATILLHNTNRAILVNQRDQTNSQRILNQLRKNQAIIQNRLPKTVAKKNIENLQPSNRNLTIKIDNLTSERLIIPDSLNIEKVNVLQISNSPILNRNDDSTKCGIPTVLPVITEIKTNPPNISADNVDINPLSKEQIIATVSIPNEIMSCDCSADDDANVTSLQLETVIQKLGTVDDGANGSFLEYDSPLLRLKSDQSWSNDPQGILCPFDVSGCCKDPKCIYIHSKDVNMAN